MKNQYTLSILGGTFDRFHAGHKSLIDAACEYSQEVHIGITTEKFYRNKVLSQMIASYEARVHAVKEYLEEKKFVNKVSVVELKDVYGESLTNRAIDAIFVTIDTQSNAELINRKRKEQGFPFIEIVTVSLVSDQNGQPITSERIRRGEIDRHGLVYLNLFRKDLLLPYVLRQELRKPIGKVIKRVARGTWRVETLLITVGDIVTLSALDAGITPALSIIDFKTQRTKLNEVEIRRRLPLQSVTYSNPAGSIHGATVKVIQQKIATYFFTTQPQVLIVEGEEDLLTLPAILVAPLGAVVLYGQVHEGAVVVEVTEEMKIRIKKLIAQFLAHEKVS